MSDKTINKELSLLSTAIKHSQEHWDWNLDNPVSGKRLVELEGPYRYLSFDEANALIQAAGQGKSGYKDSEALYLTTFIILGINTGCRSGEMLGLEWSRVDLENNRIRLEATHTKTKKARTVPLNPSASQALLAQREEQSRHGLKTPFVFAHIDSLWRGQRIGDLIFMMLYTS